MRTSEKDIAKSVAFSALFATLTCISTLLIAIPLPNGYFNLGDCFVLLSGWFLGPVYGVISAGVGSMLADIFSGFVFYAPATLVIKSLVALSAFALRYLLFKAIKKPSLVFIPCTLSAILGELIMLLGYFLFESFFYGFAGASLSLVGNATQGGCCCILAVLLFSALYPIKSVRKFFPALCKT